MVNWIAVSVGPLILIGLTLSLWIGYWMGFRAASKLALELRAKELIKDKEQPIYLIAQLSIDSMENQEHKAVQHSIIGFVRSEDEAKAIRDSSGEHIGTGWPIKQGKLMKLKEYTELKPI